jgi:hypothetical protein
MIDRKVTRSHEKHLPVIYPNLAKAYRKISLIESKIVENVTGYSADLDTLITPDGIWKREVTMRSEDYFALPAIAIKSKYDRTSIDGKSLPERIGNLIDLTLAGKRLSGGYAIGYNSHNKEHVDNVWDFTMQLLGEDASEITKVIAGYMAIGHDLGMIIDLQQHPYHSPDMLKHIFPGIESAHPELWELIQFGIEIHDSSSTTKDSISAEQIFDYYLTQKEPLLGISPREKNIIDNKHFKQAFCAFFIADKLEYGIHRTSPSAHVLELQADPHVEINAYTRTATIVQEGDTFIMSLPYIAALSEEFEEQFPHLKGIESMQKGFLLWQTEFWKGNVNRLKIAAKALFALNPSINHFVINFSDENNNITTHSVSTRIME